VVFLQGFLRKTVRRTWSFDGNYVVICGHNVVLMRTFSVGEKHANFLNFIFPQAVV